jgi:hypothetical protein
MTSHQQSINGVSFAGANGSASNSNGLDGGSTSVPVDTALTELNETLSRLASHNGVETVQILNRDGDIIIETSSNPAAAVASSSSSDAATNAVSGTNDVSAAQSTTISNNNNINNINATNAIGSNSGTPLSFLCKQAALTKNLMEVAASYVKNIDPEDGISFIQVRSKSGQDLMIAPHEGYVLAVHKR